MKLLGSTKSKITKDKNGENLPHLDMTEVVLIHDIIVSNYCQEFNHLIFHPKILYFLKLLIQNFHTLKYGLLIKILNC